MSASPYGPVNGDFIAKLEQLLGKKQVVTGREEMLDYSHDEFSLDSIHHFPDVVVFPRSPKEAAAVVKLCREFHIPLTPRGGGTGLCGGCVPLFGGVLVSLEKMKAIREIDKANLTATVDGGLMLYEFYPAVEEAGLFFPPHPGDESATFGGLAATNAGGARAVKYGVIRNFIKGLEVVLPNGELIELGGKCIKDSSGYSLMHLMIGSEGTLGLITGVTMALMPPPGNMITLVVPFEALHDAIAAVPVIMQNKVIPMAIEFVERETAEISGDFINKQWPSTAGEAHLMIVIDGMNEDEVMLQAESIGELCLEQKALDVFVADSREKQQTILEIRSGIYEAMKNYCVEILDVTVPRADIARYVDDVKAIAEEYGLWLPTYGHAADGNVHTHIMHARFHDGVWEGLPGWEEKYENVRSALHDAGRAYRGIPSGEHGIGLVKKPYLKKFLNPIHLDLMRGIKKVFDPDGIMNPGKIFD